jgi:hypothetical protein
VWQGSRSRLWRRWWLGLLVAMIKEGEGEGENEHGDVRMHCRSMIKISQSNKKGRGARIQLAFEDKAEVKYDSFQGIGRIYTLWMKSDIDFNLDSNLQFKDPKYHNMAMNSPI